MEDLRNTKYILQSVDRLREDPYLTSSVLLILAELLHVSNEKYVEKCSLLRKELVKAHGEDVDGILLRVL